MPVAVFDTRAVSVRFATGAETFSDLAAESDGDARPAPGEVVFAADAGMAIARRWCWRQSATSAATLETTRAIIVVEAHHTDSRRDVQRALDDLIALLNEHSGGTFTGAILDAAQPAC